MMWSRCGVSSGFYTVGTWASYLLTYQQQETRFKKKRIRYTDIRPLERQITQSIFCMYMTDKQDMGPELQCTHSRCACTFKVPSAVKCSKSMLAWAMRKASNQKKEPSPLLASILAAEMALLLLGRRRSRDP